MLLYFDDMLIVRKNISKVDRLKMKLDELFVMKNIKDVKQILGIRIMCDKKEKKLWL